MHIVIKIKNRMVYRIDPDETASYEPFHLDLHCLHKHKFWSAGLKGLKCHKLFVLKSYYQVNPLGSC